MPDYINREAARNALYEADAITMKGVAILNQFPAADVVEVRHGRWKQVGSITPMYECDQCHAFTLGGNFCPNCGAKMDGGQDE